MTNNSSPDRPSRQAPGGGDPWAAFGYLVAGVGFYGFLGWALGRWLHLPLLTPLGIVLGAGFGLYLVLKSLSPPPGNGPPTAKT